MDYSALAIIAGIIVYGSLEYRRREARHRSAMEYLRLGKEPPLPEGKKPEVWRLVTTGAVVIILVALVGVLVWFGFQADGYGYPYYVMALGFGLLLLILGMMFIRDLRAFRTGKGG